MSVLAGGVGAAKFIRGLVRVIPPERLTVVVNTGDDETFFGLHVSPDVDTVMYTLAGEVHPGQGWGLRDESFRVLEALGRFYGKPWFGLGDRDLATHLYRTDRLRAGAKLGDITADIAKRFGVKSRILPMSDDRVRTFVKIRGKASMPFQEYFVKGRARGFVEKIELRGIEDARPLPSVLDAIRNSGHHHPRAVESVRVARPDFRIARRARGAGGGARSRCRDKPDRRRQDHQGSGRQDAARPRHGSIGARNRAPL